ncbi:hypothetical protein PP182_19395 [Maribacter sp. PR1]|uniref:DUF4369 domain-containing protein n=1 Tax=Maribacter cobaltidurans TaxID=1178778 RepID=A0ABU7IZN8_9FLAO|nr:MULTISPECIES: hypothetical protein [Maribacter]MDC6390859.1 hypothetical protein [Maribacter sp. PR1]MEE1978251.1 hypothetical protein [Maribacter cobaltidurans]
MFKKILFYVFLVIFFSCKKDYKKITINSFIQEKSLVVEPYSFMPYSMFNLKIKGYVNDTIYVKTEGAYNLEFKLHGAIDTLWYSDYYGEGPVKCTFLPYRATEGHLDIEVKL